MYIDDECIGIDHHDGEQAEKYIDVAEEKLMNTYLASVEPRVVSIEQTISTKANRKRKHYKGRYYTLIS